MPHSEPLRAEARNGDHAAGARRSKRKPRALTATQELVFFAVTAAAALSAEAIAVLKFTAILE